MPLVTEKVKENAEKCKSCVMQRFREYLIFKKNTAGRGVFDKDTAQSLYKGTKALVDIFSKLSCNLCPYREDFERVYGMTPAEYLEKEAENLGIVK
jgi:hypothetical protein